MEVRYGSFIASAYPVEVVFSFVDSHSHPDRSALLRPFQDVAPEDRSRGVLASVNRQGQANPPPSNSLGVATQVFPTAP